MNLEQFRTTKEVVQKYDRLWQKKPDPSRDEFYRTRIIELYHRLTYEQIGYKRYLGYGWQTIEQRKFQFRCRDLNSVTYRAIVYRDLEKLFDQDVYRRRTQKSIKHIEDAYSEQSNPQSDIGELMEFLESCHIKLGSWLGFGTFQDAKDQTMLRAYINIDPLSFTWDAICQTTKWIYDNYWISGKFAGFIEPKVMAERHDCFVIYGPDLDLDDFVEAVEEICQKMKEFGLVLTDYPTPYYFAPNPRDVDERGKRESFHGRLATLAEKTVFEILSLIRGSGYPEMPVTPEKFRKACAIAFGEDGIFTEALVNENIAL